MSIIGGYIKQWALNSSWKPTELTRKTCNFTAIKTCDILQTSEVAGMWQDLRVRSHVFPTKAYIQVSVEALLNSYIRSSSRWTKTELTKTISSIACSILQDGARTSCTSTFWCRISACARPSNSTVCRACCTRAARPTAPLWPMTFGWNAKYKILEWKMQKVNVKW